MKIHHDGNQFKCSMTSSASGLEKKGGPQNGFHTDMRDDVRLIDLLPILPSLAQELDTQHRCDMGHDRITR